ncbi:putative peptide maturation dehydrogenase [Thermomonas brevis]|uniref:Putative peptide maturation dehydrogenase n=1 Tax=Thermomonas brevis TaxID=215691 RepID=A0A7G9QQC9_9GAMM|nr:putative peptide maturation dehydrogenase [Thermomonas brevis]QNN45554.1 putative peptide maturation dehydrogenase [Thermomonas brevis]
MRIRRCAVLWLEPHEETGFDLEALLAGGTGVTSRMRWLAHVPTADAPVEVDMEDVALLGAVSPNDWLAASALRDRHGAGRVRRLLRAGLLVGSTKAWAEQRARDEALRELHWHGLAASYHAGSRWEGIDAAGEVEEAGLHHAEGLRRAYGVPPPMLHERADGGAFTALPRAPRNAFDGVLDARASCRNFDAGKALSLGQLAQVLERAFGERGRVRGADDFDVLKRTSPSGGALHPVECYLIARRVDGLAVGLYHYRPGEHALQALPMDGAQILAGAGKHAAAAGKDALDYLAWIAVGGQEYFADAHALCVLAPRFRRNYWKYRNHPKAYRVCILDVGHLSQTLLLSATEMGLGSYVTAAINEADIERAFGLTHWIDGPLAVCGIGPRRGEMDTYELDPNRKVWPR